MKSLSIFFGGITEIIKFNGIEMCTKSCGFTEIKMILNGIARRFEDIKAIGSCKIVMCEFTALNCTSNYPQDKHFDEVATLGWFSIMKCEGFNVACWGSVVGFVGEVGH